MNRWSDARGAWQTIFNCISSLAAQTAPLLKDDVSTELFLMQLMAFVMQLKAFLRDVKVEREECGPRMDWQYMRVLNASACPPMQALKQLALTSREHTPEDSKLSAAIFDEVSEQIRVINHAMGTCRLIKTTPMTKGYVTTLRSFLILWLATLPLAIIGKFNWLATPVLAFISFLFLNVEKMAVEIEQPFGDDANDLPQEQYIMELEQVLLEMLPGYEPEVDEEDDPSLAMLHAAPGLPPPGGLPPGRYYMDVPPPGGTPGGAPGMQPAAQAQWNPAWANVSPAWRSQFRMQFAPNGPPGPPPPPPPGVTLPSKSRKPTPTVRR
jgi:predicted membrane chloride channel (bestrophin family)